MTTHRTTRPRLTRWRRRDSERGAALVEAALVLPVAMLIIMGIVEFGLLFGDELTVSSTVGVAARAASAHAKSNASDPGGGTGLMEQYVIPAVKSKYSARSGDILVLYRADGTNGSGDPTGLPQGISNQKDIANCGGTFQHCVKYTYSGGDWVYQSGFWNADQQSACADGVTDSVGVYLFTKHSLVSGNLLGPILANGGSSSSRDVQDHSVFRFEPIMNDCAATAP
ncbi:MAG: TadE family protein [Acidimicrobiia bacterium]